MMFYLSKEPKIMSVDKGVQENCHHTCEFVQKVIEKVVRGRFLFIYIHSSFYILQFCATVT